jgi:hypothetical protein
MNIDRRLAAGAGTQTSALAVAGISSSTTSEEFTGGPQVVARMVTGT